MRLRLIFVVSLLFHVSIGFGLRFLSGEIRSPPNPTIDVRLLSDSELKAAGGAQKPRQANARVHKNPHSKPAVSALFKVPLSPEKMFRGSGAVVTPNVVAQAETSGTRPIPVDSIYEAIPGSPGVGGAGVAEHESPLLVRMAQKIQDNTHYADILVRRRTQGQASLKLRVSPRAQILPGSLKLHCKDRLLGAYLIKTVEEALAYLEAKPDQSEAVYVIFQFQLGLNPAKAEIPSFRISKGMIQIFRHAVDPDALSINLKLFKFTGWGDSKGNGRMGPSVNFDLASLLSAKHRRRYGWDGAKVTRQVEHLELDDLKRRADRYEAEGKLLTSASG